MLPTTSADHLSNALRATSPALGCVEAIISTGDALVVPGWMRLHDDELVSIEWHTSYGESGETEVVDRFDVAGVHPTGARPHRSGFILNLSAAPRAGLSRVEITGTGRNGTQATISQPLSHELSDIPTPPSALMRRVANTSSAEVFRATGLKVYADFAAQMRRHCHIDESGVVSVLDWGCGCGRVALHFLRHEAGSKYRGCDVDPSAIDWIKHYSTGGKFDVIQPVPPTSYGGGQFQVVLSYSVLTHLSRESQLSWLEEVARVLAPGGLFIASVHGEFAASWSGLNSSELHERGVVDDTIDDALDGIVPAGYYRATFQTAPYTRKTFGAFFTVEDIVTAGAGNFQDLVVARRI